MSVCLEREAKYGSQAPSIVIMTAALLAEWLRRLTRNQLGASRVGSSPAECAFFCLVGLPLLNRLLFWLSLALLNRLQALLAFTLAFAAATHGSDQ